MNEKWKKMSEQIPVPDSLQPDRIEQMLKQKQKKRPLLHAGRLANRIAGAAAALLLVLLAANILHGMVASPEKNAEQVASRGDSSQDTSSQEASSQEASSQENSPQEDSSDENASADTDQDKTSDLSESTETSEQTMPHTSYAKLEKAISDHFSDITMGSATKDAAMPENRMAEQYTSGSQTSEIASREEIASEAETSMDTAKQDSYTKTDLQVEGVDEGDIVKTDGTYIYSCTENAGGSRINIYRADGKNTEKVSKISIPKTSVDEMYIDQNNLVTVGTSWDDENDSLSGSSSSSQKKAYYDLAYRNGNTCISVYDLTDKKQPKCLSEKKQSGSYYTSRKNGNYVYTLSRMYTEPVKDKDDKRSFVPSADGNVLSEEQLYLPDHVASNCYLVLTALDVTNGEKFSDSLSVLGGGDICYVSEKHIFVATGLFDSGTKTSISKYGYENGKLKALTSETFNGMLHDQFSMDEYDDTLRFVATTYHKNGATSNGLYVLDKNLSMIGSVDNLAKDEEIYSARFLGTRAYFVTYRNTDPVFLADLTDPAHPVIKDKLKIPGFSEYLHTYGDDLLLGIGSNQMKDGSMQVKLSMFDISSDSSVTENHKKLLEKETNSIAGNNHKAVLVDKERNRIGLCVYSFRDDNRSGDGGYSYRIYSYDGKGFHTVAKLRPKDLSMSARGLYIGDHFYLVDDIAGSSGIHVYDADTFEKEK